MVWEEILQDTRNPQNPNICSNCGARVQPTFCDCTERYSIYIFTCPQCGAAFTLLMEHQTDDITDME